MASALMESVRRESVISLDLQQHYSLSCIDACNFVRQVTNNMSRCLCYSVLSLHNCSKIRKV